MLTRPTPRAELRPLDRQEWWDLSFSISLMVAAVLLQVWVITLVIRWIWG
jgi:hypothetical protein